MEPHAPASTPQAHHAARGSSPQDGPNQAPKDSSTNGTVGAQGPRGPILRPLHSRPIGQPTTPGWGPATHGAAMPSVDPVDVALYGMLGFAGGYLLSLSLALAVRHGLAGPALDVSSGALLLCGVLLGTALGVAHALRPQARHLRFLRDLRAVAGAIDPTPVTAQTAALVEGWIGADSLPKGRWRIMVGWTATPKGLVAGTIHLLDARATTPGSGDDGEASSHPDGHVGRAYDQLHATNLFPHHALVPWTRVLPTDQLPAGRRLGRGTLPPTFHVGGGPLLLDSAHGRLATLAALDHQARPRATPSASPRPPQDRPARL